ncbi:MAG: hypothetical protein PHN90_01320 [Methanothrix sp.]|nr:hypothetical protein [Methanothrix sp.]HNR58999.1 hypothetical protein [Methanothrix sp.]
MKTTCILLLMAAMAAANSAAASLVTIEAGDCSIAIDADLVRNDTQEAEAGRITYPLVVRGSAWPEAVASAMNFTRQTFTIGSASEDLADVPHDLLTLDSNVGIQIETYSEPPEGGLPTTPFGLGGEVANLTITAVKDVTVGRINPRETSLYKAVWEYGDGLALPAVYLVLFAVDDRTVCRIESVSGVSGEMAAEEFEEFLARVDVIPQAPASSDER